MLLFGTFRVIASNSERAGTGMSSEAIGVSVAPSFFQSCVSDGKTARMEDVLRYKVGNIAPFYRIGFRFSPIARLLNLWALITEMDFKFFFPSRLCEISPDVHFSPILPVRGFTQR